MIFIAVVFMYVLICIREACSFEQEPVDTPVRESACKWSCACESVRALQSVLSHALWEAK